MIQDLELFQGAVERVGKGFERNGCDFITEWNKGENINNACISSLVCLLAATSQDKEHRQWN